MNGPRSARWLRGWPRRTPTCHGGANESLVAFDLICQRLLPGCEAGPVSVIQGWVGQRLAFQSRFRTGAVPGGQHVLPGFGHKGGGFLADDLDLSMGLLPHPPNFFCEEALSLDGLVPELGDTSLRGLASCFDFLDG